MKKSPADFLIAKRRTVSKLVCIDFVYVAWLQKYKQACSSLSFGNLRLIENVDFCYEFK